MGTTNVKDEARKLIEKLPEKSTCDDVMREIYHRQANDDARRASTAVAR
jgi:hypothetical protein